MPGDEYIGFWQNDKKHGKGKLIYSSGDLYDGLWQSDMKSNYLVNIWIYKLNIYLSIVFILEIISKTQ